MKDAVTEPFSKKASPKIPCQTVELMIEPEYCRKISNKGTFCCCEHARKLGLINEGLKKQ